MDELINNVYYNTLLKIINDLKKRKISIEFQIKIMEAEKQKILKEYYDKKGRENI